MLARQKMEPAPGIGPESIAYQAITLPLSYADWSRTGNSKPVIRFTKPAPHRQGLSDVGAAEAIRTPVISLED